MFRYTEIEKSNRILSSEELSETIENIEREYKGLILPGDKVSLEDMKEEIRFFKERIKHLEQQEETIDILDKQNE